jgi:hypothetical protein
MFTLILHTRLPFGSNFGLNGIPTHFKVMRILAALLLTITTGVVFGQGNKTSKAGFSLADHFMAYTWIYIVAFVGLVGFFVAAYMMGWDKKLFKAKMKEEHQPMFI